MATRGKMTFQKRQKEAARKDKQLRKAERKAQRKLDPSDPEMQEVDAEPTAEMEANTEPPEV
jgi:hypothetical protein